MGVVKTATHLARLEAAIRAAVREHGPDLGTLGCSQLQRLYGGPPAQLAGKLGRRFFAEPVRAVDALVRYNVEARRFVVDPRPVKP